MLETVFAIACLATDADGGESIDISFARRMRALSTSL